jgi:hypothetical protein
MEAQYIIVLAAQGRTVLTTPVPTIALVVVFVLVVLSLDAPFGDLLHTI